MVIANSSSRSSSMPDERDDSVDREISFGIKVFLGVFIILMAVVGIVGNTIVITVLRSNNTFMRKTTSLILTNLAVVDLLGCAVNIPLAFCTVIAGAPVGHLYQLSLAHVAFGPCLFWGYITCFFLLSVNRNDALRKMSNRQELLTTKRILIVLILAIASGAGIAVFFVVKIENPNPLLPRRTAPKVLTIARGILFLLFVIAVASNIYLCMRVKKLVKEHSENIPSEFQEQRNQWQIKERNISWTTIQVVLVVCFSYVPYIVASTIYSNVDIRSLNAIAICRSLTYLKYAVNVFIFTRLDGRFLKAFVDTLRGGSCSANNKVCAEPLELPAREKSPTFYHHDEGVRGNNEPTVEPVNFNGHSLGSGHQSRDLFVLVRESRRTRKRAQTINVNHPLPIITITSPTGKTTILKRKQSRSHKRKKSVQRNKCTTSVRARAKTL